MAKARMMAMHLAAAILSAALPAAGLDAQEEGGLFEPIGETVAGVLRDSLAPPPGKGGRSPANIPGVPVRVGRGRRAPARYDGPALRRDGWAYLLMPRALENALRGPYGREDAPQTAAIVNGRAARPLGVMIKTPYKVTSIPADGATTEAVSDRKMDELCRLLRPGAERCGADILRVELTGREEAVEILIPDPARPGRLLGFSFGPLRDARAHAPAGAAGDPCAGGRVVEVGGRRVTILGKRACYDGRDIRAALKAWSLERETADGERRELLDYMIGKYRAILDDVRAAGYLD